MHKSSVQMHLEPQLTLNYSKTTKTDLIGKIIPDLEKLSTIPVTRFFTIGMKYDPATAIFTDREYIRRLLHQKITSTFTMRE